MENLGIADHGKEVQKSNQLSYFNSLTANMNGIEQKNLLLEVI
jgi:hypothetical protein